MFKEPEDNILTFRIDYTCTYHFTLCDRINKYHLFPSRFWGGGHAFWSTFTIVSEIFSHRFI
jgi:hypothetical protein